MLIIRRVNPEDQNVAPVIASHFALMRATSPEESCHVMSASDLAAGNTTCFAAFEENTVLGIGALKPLDADHGELKSMHTLADARGKGVGRAILRRLFQEAHQIGLTQLSLETGSMDAFEPARRLYASEGFSECSPFADYVLDPLSFFMTKTL